MTRRYHLDSGLIREQMKLQNLNHLQLAVEADLGLRSVTEILGREQSAVSSRTAIKLAKGLKVDIDEISLGWLSDWQTVPEIGKRRHIDILRRAIRFDMKGDHTRAAHECKRVLKEMSKNDEGYPLVVVKYVSFLGNCGKHAEALVLLDEVLAAETGSSLPRLWALYQRGIALRRMTRFGEARAAFEELRGHKQPFGASALHQLAAVDLEQAKRSHGIAREALFADAERYLNACLEAWRPFGRTHRKGFAQQRLGELAKLRGQIDLARKHYTEALITFSWEHCQRYVDGVRRDLEQLHTTATLMASAPSRGGSAGAPPHSVGQPYL